MAIDDGMKSLFVVEGVHGDPHLLKVSIRARHEDAAYELARLGQWMVPPGYRYVGFSVGPAKNSRGSRKRLRHNVTIRFRKDQARPPIGVVEARRFFAPWWGVSQRWEDPPAMSQRCDVLSAGSANSKS